jgi:flagellar biosynthesis/type III secretory pathway chaperone
MNAQSLKRPFRATIEASLAGLRQLHDILLEEQQALLSDQPEALEQIVRQKSESLEQLEHSIQAREQILEQAGLPGGMVGAQQFAHEHFAAEELHEDADALLSLSNEVRDLNIHNGKLTLARERTTREALGILTGRPQDNDTYSRSGAGGRRLAAYSLGRC